jgi:hypothetical protein
MKKSFFVLLLSAFVLLLNGQGPTPENPVFPKFNIGLGAGIDYGGFGGRATILVAEKLEFFGAIGYNLLTAGFNVGTGYRLIPKSILCPYLGAMYGYNGVIKVEGLDEYNKVYYGPSFSAGLEIWSKRRPTFINLELILPLRSQAYHDAITSLKNNPGIVFTSEPIPIAFSIGFHFILQGNMQ